jgi:sulfite reductase (NADPH) flavoprotein alpha-component
LEKVTLLLVFLFNNTLIDVIEKEGAMTHEAAEAYLNDIQKQGRYQRDVY